MNGIMVQKQTQKKEGTDKAPVVHATKDYSIFKEMLQFWTPAIAMVEHRDRNADWNEQASWPELNALASRHDLQLICLSRCNSIFLRKDLVDKLSMGS